MSKTAVYHTTVQWKGEHWGHVVMGNGPEMSFSAPPDAHGHANGLTTVTNQNPLHDRPFAGIA
ncbi:MAG: hypothetical protein R6X32_19260, partial [Chloroflexota bacterium]